MKGTKSQGKPKVKDVSSRKPPEPTASHADIDQWLGRVMPGLHPIVTSVDRLIRKTIPGLHYAVKWKKAHYGLPEQGWVIEMVAYDISVNIVFFGGADFDPPPPLGSVGRSRYVKLTSAAEAETPELRKWIQQAGSVRGWR